jgi:hypothetical protein
MGEAKPKLHLHDLIEEKARQDGGYAVAYALLRLADAQDRTALWLKHLGLADAATPMGAIEVLSVEFKRMADSMTSIAEGVEQFLDERA